MSSMSETVSLQPGRIVRPPVCDGTNVLMLFIGLVHSQSSRRVDGPLGLMGNGIILRGSGLADTSGHGYPTID